MSSRSFLAPSSPFIFRYRKQFPYFPPPLLLSSMLTLPPEAVHAQTWRRSRALSSESFPQFYLPVTLACTNYGSKVLINFSMRRRSQTPFRCASTCAHGGTCATLHCIGWISEITLSIVESAVTRNVLCWRFSRSCCEAGALRKRISSRWTRLWTLISVEGLLWIEDQHRNEPEMRLRGLIQRSVQATPNRNSSKEVDFISDYDEVIIDAERVYSSKLVIFHERGSEPALGTCLRDFIDRCNECIRLNVPIMESKMAFKSGTMFWRISKSRLEL